MIRIVVVDDQKIFREGLKTLLGSAPDLKVVGTAPDARTGIQLVHALSPDIVLIDVEMPGINGLIATQMICSRFDTKVIVLSSFNKQEYLAKSISVGAKAYVLKSTHYQELQEVIRSIHKGYLQVGPGLFEDILPSLLMAKKTIKEPEASGELAVQKTEETEKYPQVFYNFVPKEIKWYQLVIFFLLGLGLSISMYHLRKRSRQPTPSVISASSIVHLSSQEFSGQIQLAQNFNVIAHSFGLIENIYVKVGDRVKIDETLLDVKNIDLANKLQTQQKKLFEQKQTLLEQSKIFNNLPKEEIDQKIKEIDKEVAQASDGLNGTLQQTIKAEREGIVTKIFTAKGVSINPNDFLLSIAPLNLLKVQLVVDEEIVEKLNIGKEALIKINIDGREQYFWGKITELNKSVIIEFTNSDNLLLVNKTAKVYFN